MNPTTLPDATITYWTRVGWLKLQRPGTGQHREYPPSELRAAAAIDSLRHLGGVTPRQGDTSRANAQLRDKVATAARSNPSGAIVEVPCGVPNVRIVLVVP